MSCLKRIPVLVFAISMLFAAAAEAKIEATRGKRYPLHKAHGPHMILVTTLRNVNPGLKTKGMTAEEAADEIVYALRVEGIPAYVYYQQEELSRQGTFRARQEELAIMAGNFPSPDHRVAQIVLKYIQNKFQPEFLNRRESGAIIAKQMAAKPFSRAFIIANPLRSAAEIRSDAVKKGLKKLNSDSGDLSLLKSRGTYSVKVATFSGNTVLQVSGRDSEEALNWFQDTFGRNMDQNGQSAWELATALRQASKYGYGRDYEAWVLHNRHKSYVTVGSFDSPDDPAIRQLVEEFRAKPKPNPKTGRRELTPELFSIPKTPTGKTLPDKLWFFDQNPRAIRIPGK